MPSARKPRNSARVCIIGAAVLLAAAGIAVFSYQSCRALRIDHSLATGRWTTQAIEQFVEKTGHWPASWSDIATIEADTRSMKERIIVDFDARLETLAHQSVDEFSAIEPREFVPGNYKEYWHVESLLRTINRVRERELENAGS